MRLPSILLGLLCWFLVSRLLLPRLGHAGRLRSTPWVAALAFGTWFVPLDLGLRPEPWVAVGTVLAFLAVERAVATRRILPRGWWRPRPVDATVTALLGVWWVIGSGTVDDGYIAGIVRSRGDNGFVGNVYRWLNAPEAPFSWFYEPYH